MMPPELKSIGSALELSWPDKQVIVTVDGFKDSSRAPEAEVSVKVTAPGYKGALLAPTNLNLMSLQARSGWAKTLKGRYGEANWEEILEHVCHRALSHYREGEPFLVLREEADWRPIPFYLSPFLFDGYVTILHGPGGGGKSYLGLLAAMLCDGYQQYAGICPAREGKALYLDWESEDRDLNARAAKYRKGMGLTGQPVYRRCLRPLADDLRRIQRYVAQERITCVIIDSLAPACGADLFAADTAIRFMTALRTLKVSTLVLAHQPKHQEEGKEATVYGSVFFHNLARSVWELKKVQEVGADTREIGLFHRKCNLARLHKPLGFRILEPDGGDTIAFESMPLEESEALSVGLSDTERVKRTLVQDGPGTAKTLAERVNLDASRVRVALSRGRGVWCAETGKEGREMVWEIVEEVKISR
ncbi:MAG: hypothetical protein FJ245_11810 [Nitrospira sp.]|nr:hypothetical protein [Nitrospira sp.]